MPMGGPLSLWEKPSCKKLRGPMGGTKRSGFDLERRSKGAAE